MKGLPSKFKWRKLRGHFGSSSSSSNKAERRSSSDDERDAIAAGYARHESFSSMDDDHVVVEDGACGMGSDRHSKESEAQSAGFLPPPQSSRQSQSHHQPSSMSSLLSSSGAMLPPVIERIHSESSCDEAPSPPPLLVADFDPEAGAQSGGGGGLQLSSAFGRSTLASATTAGSGGENRDLNSSGTSEADPHFYPSLPDELDDEEERSFRTARSVEGGDASTTTAHRSLKSAATASTARTRHTHRGGEKTKAPAVAAEEDDDEDGVPLRRPSGGMDYVDVHDADGDRHLQQAMEEERSYRTAQSQSRHHPNKPPLAPRPASDHRRTGSGEGADDDSSEVRSRSSQRSKSSLSHKRRSHKGDKSSPLRTFLTDIMHHGPHHHKGDHAASEQPHDDGKSTDDDEEEQERKDGPPLVLVPQKDGYGPLSKHHESSKAAQTTRDDKHHRRGSGSGNGNGIGGGGGSGSHDRHSSSNKRRSTKQSKRPSEPTGSSDKGDSKAKNDKIRRLRAERDSLSAYCDGLEEKLARTERDLDAIQNEKDQRISTLENELHDSSYSVKSLMSVTTFEMNERLQVIRALSKAASKQKDRIHKQRELIEMLKSEVDKAQRDADRCRDERDRAVTEKRKIQDELVEQAVAKTGMRMSLQKSKSKLSSLEKNSAAYKIKVDKLKKKLSDANEKIARLEGSTVAKAVQVQKAEEELLMKNQEIESVRCDLEERMRSVVTLELELEESKAQISELRLRLEHSEERAFRATQEAQALGISEDGAVEMAAAAGAAKGGDDKESFVLTPPSSPGGRFKSMFGGKNKSNSNSDGVLQTANDYEASLHERDRRIEELEVAAAFSKKSVDKLKSDLVKVSASYKHNEYQQRMKIEKLMQENTAYAIKVNVLESEFSSVTSETSSLTSAGSVNSASSMSTLRSERSVESDRSRGSTVASARSAASARSSGAAAASSPPRAGPSSSSVASSMDEERSTASGQNSGEGGGKQGKTTGLPSSSQQSVSSAASGASGTSHESHPRGASVQLDWSTTHVERIRELEEAMDALDRGSDALRREVVARDARIEQLTDQMKKSERKHESHLVANRVEIDRLREENQEKGEKISALEEALLKGEGGGGAAGAALEAVSRTVSSDEDMDVDEYATVDDLRADIKKRDAKIEQLQNLCEVREATVKSLRSELFDLRMTTKSDGYRKDRELERLRDENRVHVEKVEILEKEFMEMNQKRKDEVDDGDSDDGQRATTSAQVGAASPGLETALAKSKSTIERLDQQVDELRLEADRNKEKHQQEIESLNKMYERLKSDMQDRLVTLEVEKRMKEEELQTRLQCRETTIDTLEKTLNQILQGRMNKQMSRRGKKMRSSRSKAALVAKETVAANANKLEQIQEEEEEE